ncbi:MAG: ABC transporter ATP-binding protein [Velocimicrobium sp.]
MLQLKNLTKKYGDFTAVSNVSLEVSEGEIFGLLGPNGAGKSTIVSMISTVLAPTNGTIIINGSSLLDNTNECKKQTSIVPQDLALYQSLSAKDNFEFFGCLYGLSGKKLQNKVQEVLDILQLTDRANQEVEKYSGGMKRRVNIGIALMNDPKLLILDEPTVGIDPQSRNHILETIIRLNQEKKMTIVYTSHYMEEVDYLCKRVAIIDHGALIALGSKEELKQTLNVCDTLTLTFREANPSSLNMLQQMEGVVNMSIDKNKITLLISSAHTNVINLIEQIKNLKIELSSFQYDEVNLESIFLQITGKSLRD